ncbi:hypothetical protein [Vibrio parahaemolyticus]|uniref:hypothetical protein n=1 Tax=Vibrio parahaemolyticus TaxID=670 RepID=UPI00111DBFDC|nr:hypothetical protein [Vibrio parahaemolyticus]TOG48138.1 hypothetical protein CGJ00_12175 [Vibrio parahaemolyticus]
MKSLLNRTPENKYANIVYAGAGKGENIAALKLWTEGNIITIDPNTQASKLLKGHHPEVKHYTAALSTENGEQDFYEYWPESLGTLRDTVTLPNELKNAQLKSTRAVETLSLNAILSEWEFDSDYNLLLLSTNGLELEIINSLSSNELDSFSCLIIEVDNKNIYHQSIEYIESMKSNLVYLGYYLSDLEHDAMSSSFIFLRDENKKATELERNNLASRVSSLEASISELTTKNTELADIRKATELERNNLASRVSSLEASVSELTTKNIEFADISKALEGEKNQTQEELNLVQSSVQDLTQKLEQKIQKLEVIKKELRTKTSELDRERKNKINLDSFYIDSSLHELVDGDEFDSILFSGYLPAKNTNGTKYLEMVVSKLHGDLFIKALECLNKEIKLSMLKSLHNVSLMVTNAISSSDIHKSTDDYLLDDNVKEVDKFIFCCLMSSEMEYIKNGVMTQHYINLAKDYVWGDNANKLHLFLYLAKCFEIIGRKNDAALVMFDLFESDFGLNKSDMQNIFFDSFEKISSTFKKIQHGHDVLLDYLKLNAKAFKAEGRRPTLIEIGTTRELVSGQGSTLEIARFCFENDFEFISVDMDEHNTRVANAGFKKYGYPFQAITMKGEDFLAKFPDSIDVLFLDAYDFDHGNHSDLRQERYQKFLGSRIDEELCHKMHLECVENVQNKMASQGVICIDDTWVENGNWTAKGTTAVPYLLDNGFELIEDRNRAALFKLGAHDRISKK